MYIKQTESPFELKMSFGDKKDLKDLPQPLQVYIKRYYEETRLSVVTEGQEVWTNFYNDFNK